MARGKPRRQAAVDPSLKSSQNVDETLPTAQESVREEAAVKNERYEFFRQIRPAQLELLRKNPVMTEENETPRQTYLRAILPDRLVEGTLPLPVLLRRRESAPNALDLNGAGVGDAIVQALTAVITSLDGLDTLLLKDNRLTDRSLTPLCNIACKLPWLTALDLSENDMDESAKALRTYLAQQTCRLQKLCLSKADVDDQECAEFMDAVRSNKSLTALCLSHNLIGDAEIFNTVNPDLITGGEAIGAMLRDNYKLTDLDLSWNKIRKDSARELGNALGVNSTLTKLNLAHNGFADEPTQYLGLALGENVALAQLDLSFNAVTPTAAMVLASAFHSNHTLTELNLSGNPVGKRGGEALVTAVRRFQLPDRLLMINLTNADLEFEGGTQNQVFNPTTPNGEYVLDMTTPYGQMVAKELYHLATSSQACYFKKLVHRQDDGTVNNIELKRKREKRKALVNQIKNVVREYEEPWFQPATELLRLVTNRRKSTGEEATFGAGGNKANVSSEYNIEASAEMHNALGNLLRSLQVKPTKECVRCLLKVFRFRSKGLDGLLFSVFMALFDFIDYNKSEAIGVKEMCRGLTLLGVEDASFELATRIVTTYDVDGTHQIERNEFVHWAMGAFLSRKLDKLDTLIDTRTKTKWRPPTRGILCVSFVAEPRLAGIDVQGSNIGNRGLMKNIHAAASDIDRGRLFEKAVTNTDISFTFSQAQQLIEECNVGLNQLEMMSKLLPVMSSTDDACLLVESCLPLQERVRLREKMGPPLFDACTSNPTGCYSLDLRDELDRKAAFMFAQVNSAHVTVSRAADRRDTSQKGNWQNFRNEFYDDTATELSTQWFVNMPQRGRLRFDFVSTRRPEISSQVLCPQKFLELCQVLDLEKDLQRVHDYFKSMNPLTKRRNSFFLASTNRRTIHHSSNIFPSYKFDDDSTSSVRESEESSSQCTATSSGDRSHRAVGNCLGVSLPRWMLRRYVVSNWHLHMQSTHLKCDWLGLEKTRDTAKVLGIDDRDTLAKSASGKKPPTSAIAEEGSRDSSRKRRKSANNGAPAPARHRAQHDLDGSVSTTSFAEGSEDEVSLEIKRKPKESEAESDPAAEFAPFEFVPAPFTKADAKTVPCKAYAIIYYKIALLRVATMSLWLSVDQISFIVKQFPVDDFARVFVAVALHARCYDLDNFHILVKALEPQEQVELFHRLGFLNCLNPNQPDRIYVLDLRWWDHRQLCRVLVKLAIEEPGTNWINEAYRWSQFDVTVPGWTLPQSWSLEDHELHGEGGPRRFGRLRLRYTSDPAMGCEPVWSVRRRLKSRFLCGHDDYRQLHKSSRKT